MCVFAYTRDRRTLRLMQPVTGFVEAILVSLFVPIPSPPLPDAPHASISHACSSLLSISFVSVRHPTTSSSSHCTATFQAAPEEKSEGPFGVREGTEPSDGASVMSAMSTTSRSSFLSVITGTGERSAPTTTTTASKRHSSCPYLLLDVRSDDAFEKCHIVGGKLASRPPPSRVMRALSHGCVFVVCT